MPHRKSNASAALQGIERSSTGIPFLAICFVTQHAGAMNGLDGRSSADVEITLCMSQRHSADIRLGPRGPAPSCQNRGARCAVRHRSRCLATFRSGGLADDCARRGGVRNRGTQALARMPALGQDVTRIECHFTRLAKAADAAVWGRRSTSIQARHMPSRSRCSTRAEPTIPSPRRRPGG